MKGLAEDAQRVGDRAKIYTQIVVTGDYTLSAVLLLDDDGDGDGDASTVLHASPVPQCLMCANASQYPCDGFCGHLYFAGGETGGPEK